ncbi:MAG: trehalase family glycosidase [Prolixibacteraceae bacterium]
MKQIIFILFSVLITVGSLSAQNENWEKYVPIIKTHIYNDYKGMFKEEGGALKHPYITPGSDQYSDVLWDWDSWLTNVAVRQILIDKGNAKEKKEALKYEQGCVLNYLEYGGMDGWIPYIINRKSPARYEWLQDKDEKTGGPFETNMHKPCLAQHAAFLVQQDGEVEWLREKFYFLQAFVNAYMNHLTHKPTGLAFWANDQGIGVDNDPSTYYRPDKSSGNIYLNAMLYKEIEAMVFLAGKLNLSEIAVAYQKDADRLKVNIQEHCWDERDGCYYSVDLNLSDYHRPEKYWSLHIGAPRNWDCLIQRIDGWSGFMALWAGIATEEQAERIVKEHYQDSTRFNCPYGIRTLSPLEKMYNVKATGNPSSWLGPIWGVSNYLVFQGLLKYGYETEAREMAIETVLLFGKDYERNGALHEYYMPENGEPVLNKGFQNWNYLVLNMIAYLEGTERIVEF